MIGASVAAAVAFPVFAQVGPALPALVDGLASGPSILNAVAAFLGGVVGARTSGARAIERHARDCPARAAFLTTGGKE